jgi:hypothetical protein
MEVTHSFILSRTRLESYIAGVLIIPLFVLGSGCSPGAVDAPSTDPMREHLASDPV